MPHGERSNSRRSSGKSRSQIKRFIWLQGKRHPKDMAEPAGWAFLSNLATQRGVSASTQNQAGFPGFHRVTFIFKSIVYRPPRVATCAGVTAEIANV
jgi:hypothetical protein